jgi:transposase InsO family protein
MWTRLSIQEGVLKRRFEEINDSYHRWQVIIPKKYRYEFLEIAHGGMTGGHLGPAKTAEAIQLRGYWPTWKTDLAMFMKTCEPCARYHRGAIKRQAPLQTPHLGEPWERVSIDITGPHPRSSSGKVYILTLVDHFTKWAEAFALTNHTAPTVAKILITQVFSRYGTPMQILSDQGPEFESELFKELLKWMEIDKIRCSPYRPSTNAACERFHRTLNSMLAKVMKESQKDWDEQLPMVMAAYRASPHSATGYSPNRMFLGRENRMPLDLIMGVPTEDGMQPISTDEFVQRTKEEAVACYDLAREELRVAAERRKKTYDVKVKKAEFHVGEWVWYWYPRRYTKRSHKWQKMYVGPYLIIRAIEPVNFVIQKSPQSKPLVVHVDKLKKCYGETPKSWLNSSVITHTDEIQGAAVDDNDVSPESQAASPIKMSERRERLINENLVNEEQEVLVQPNSAFQRPRRDVRKPPSRLRDYQC